MAPTVLGVLLAPMERPPVATFTPPPKVLVVPERRSRPAPVLLMPAVALFVELLTSALTFSVGVRFATVVLPFTVTGATLKVRVAPFRSSAPTPVLVIALTAPTFDDVATTLPVSERMPVPSETVGAAPPWLLKLRPARVWLKLFRFRVPWPFRTGTTAGSIWLPCRKVTVAPPTTRESAAL